MGKLSRLFPGLVLLAPALGIASPHAGERWTQYSNYTTISRMADGGRVLWLATDGGLVRLDKTSGEKTYFNHINSVFTDSRILGVTSDEAGRVWASTQGGMLAEFDGRWTHLNAAGSPLEGELVLDIAWDFRGSLWVLAAEAGTRKPSVFRRQDGQWTRLYLENVDPLFEYSSGYGYGNTYGHSFSYGVIIYGNIYGVQPVYLQVDGEGRAWVLARSGNRPMLYRIAPSGKVDTVETPQHLAPRWFIAPRSGNPFWVCTRLLATPTEAGWDTVSLPQGVHGMAASHPHNSFARTSDGGFYLALNRLARYRDGAWEAAVPIPGDSLGSYPLLIGSVAGSDCPQGDCLRMARGGRFGNLAGSSWTFDRIGSTSNLPSPVEILHPRRSGSPEILMSSYRDLKAFDPATSRTTPVDLGSVLANGNRILSLGEDHRERLWMRSSGLLIRMGEDGLKSFTSDNSPWMGVADNLPGAAGFLAVDARGTVWAADSDKLIAIPDGSDDVGTWRIHRLPAVANSEAVLVNTLVLHEDGSLWFSGRVVGVDPAVRNLIGRYDGNAWRIFGASDHAWIDSLTVLDLRCTGDGQVWARFQAGLLQWDGAAWKEHGRIPASPLRTGVQALTVDAEGRLWAATSPPEAGLLRWNGRWESVNDSKSRMATSPVRSMAFDGSGRLWMAMTWDGVMVFDPSGTVSTRTADGRMHAQASAPTLDRIAHGLWRLSPGALSGEDNLAVRILDLRGAALPGTEARLRPAAGGIWTWPGPGRRLPPGKYLLSLQGRHDRMVVLPFLHGRP